MARRGRKKAGEVPKIEPIESSKDQIVDHDVHNIKIDEVHQTSNKKRKVRKPRQSQDINIPINIVKNETIKAHNDPASAKKKRKTLCSVNKKVHLNNTTNSLVDDLKTEGVVDIKPEINDFEQLSDSDDEIVEVKKKRKRQNYSETVNKDSSKRRSANTSKKNIALVSKNDDVEQSVITSVTKKSSLRKPRKKVGLKKNDSEAPEHNNLSLHEDKQNLSSLASVKPNAKDASSSSESEWEEVPEEMEQNLDDYNPELPEGGVEITIKEPSIVRRRVKKAFDILGYIRCQINRVKKEVQLSVHQTHLLCLIAHGMHVNNILNSDDVKAYAISLLPVDFFTVAKKPSKVNCDMLKNLVDWFTDTFVVEKNASLSTGSIKDQICSAFERQVLSDVSEFNVIFVGIARTLGLDVRLCISLYPVSFKPTDLLKKTTKLNSDKTVKEEKQEQSTEKNINNNMKDKTKKIKSKPKDSKPLKKCPKSKKPKMASRASETFDINDVASTSASRSRPKRSKREASYKMSSDDNDAGDDDVDFKVKKNYDDNDSGDSGEPSPKKKRPLSTSGSVVKTKTTNTGVRNRKILSDDSDSDTPIKGVECWAEIYSKAECKWVCIECFHKIIDQPYDIESVATQPVSYVLAFDNKSRIKDVTKRYCAEWLTSTRKLRIDPDWWEETLDPFLPPNNKFDKAEETQLEKALVDQPMPSTVSEFKNHPLYALKRHLLKFQGIYPPDAPSIGFIRGEPVYSRECIQNLHSRETWLKEARVVRIGEEPYKIVKARPKWDKLAGVMRTDLPLELFGLWQTEDYMPPIAQNGKVPRNAYGNVELFKPCMLPVGTVHLQIPCLNRIAKKLGIDCSPAVVGFDGHKGSVHPVFDGFIVCEEYKDTLLAAWDEEQENTRKREEEKRLKRIYGNWKKLVKGLFIRERIKAKYGAKQ